MRRVRYAGVLLVIVGVVGIVGLALSACAPGGTDDLAGTGWRLVSFGPRGSETPALQGTPVTLQFEEDGQAGGSAGCNSYGGTYEVQGNTLSFGEIVSTLMACADEQVNQQEQQYLEALRSAGAFELQGDSLTIEYDAGDRQGVLNFTSENTQG